MTDQSDQPRTRRRVAVALGAVLLATTVAATMAPPSATPALAQTSAPAWTVNQARSSIGFATNWAGQRVGGSFATWSADINFDPDNLAGSRVRAVIQTGSVRSNVAEARDNLPGQDWLASRAFPTAVYEASSFTRLSGNNYRANGFLTLKGVRYRLALPFTLTISGDTATMNGTIGINRLTVGVGKESDASAEWVDSTTNVTVQLTATRR